jgi:hypothetical protein
MKYLLLLAMFLASCAPPVPVCQPGALLGSDNQCYSCNYGTPEFASSEFGYCGSVSAGGVACCSSVFYNFNSITCYPSEPWLCSDALCHTSNIGACVYAP